VQSKLFTFKFDTGERKDDVKVFAELKVHTEAITATSDQLAALINNGMKESQEECAELDDISKDDFLLFYEYAVRGDYTVPPHQIDHSVAVASPREPSLMLQDAYRKYTVATEAAAVDSTQALRDGTPQAIRKKQSELAWTDVPINIPQSFPFPRVTVSAEIAKNRQDTHPKESLRMRFKWRNYLPADHPKAAIQHGLDAPVKTGPEQDLKPIFLTHARLYTFAEKRFILPLRQLALSKLHETLVHFTLHEERIGDILELVRYAYKNNQNRKDDGTIDQLRELVVLYIVKEIDTVVKSEDWQTLVYEGKEMMVDFWRLGERHKILTGNKIG
jgi:hypothetical protein